MNISSETLLIILATGIFILFASAVYFRINQARILGKRGERKVASKLLSLSKEYKLFNDIYIEVEGRSIQIDHVIMSQYGIFVIETKNYSGWIYGTGKSDYWTKNVFGTKFRFRNPLKQNYAHIKSLQTLLEVPQNKFFSIVVFLNDATLKCDTYGTVIHSYQLKETILNYTKALFTSDEVELLSEKLQSALITDKIKKKDHAYRVQEYINQRQSLIAFRICPRCKGALVERQGKHGKFLGCSNYPKCKFTAKL